jgi:hypothetical protein
VNLAGFEESEGYAMTAFEDIAIVGLDVMRTRQSDKAPGLRHMFLSLSARPSSAWAEMFTAERRFPRHTMWRKAWVEGSAIVVDCVPEEIESHHLGDLRQDVTNTNRKYRDYLTRVHAQDARHEAAEAQERDRLASLRDRLSF